METDDGIKRSEFNFFNLFKKSRTKEIEGCASGLEKKAIELINFYGPKADYILTNGGFAISESWDGDGNYCKTIYNLGALLPYGGRYARPKLVSDGCGKGGMICIGKEDSEKYTIMKNFLNKYPDYSTRNAKSVRKYYGLE